MHLTWGLNLIAVRNLCLVCSMFPYSGTFVLVVASCGMTFVAIPTYVYQYLCADGQEKYAL